MTEDEGDCFEVAYATAQQIPGSEIVHGIPLGQAGNAEGRRYWHAWVELNGLVFDFSNGLQVIMRSERYYRIGDVKLMWRFKEDEYEYQALNFEHYGPWVDDYEMYVDG